MFLIFCCTCLRAQDDITTFIFLRHAEKAAVGSDPYLSEAGNKQAKCVGKLLALENVKAIYSTPYNRTLQTAAPIAEHHQLEVSKYDASNAKIIDELKQKHKGQVVVVVGHSNTVPLFLNSLSGTASYKQMEENEYNKVFIAVASNYKPVKIITLQIPCE